MIRDLDRRLLDLTDKIELHKKDRVLEIGTGSGILTFLLKRRQPNAFYTATDIEEANVRLAELNAVVMGLTSLEFLSGDLFKPVLGRDFNVIFSNPPWYPDNPRGRFQRAKFDPVRNGSGRVINRYIEGLGSMLKPGDKDLIHIPLSMEDNHVLFIEPGGHLENFPVPAEYSHPAFDKFAWWFKNNLLPAAVQNGFTEIKMMQGPSSDEDLERLGFVSDGDSFTPTYSYRIPDVLISDTRSELRKTARQIAEIFEGQTFSPQEIDLASRGTENLIARRRVSIAGLSAEIRSAIERRELKMISDQLIRQKINDLISGMAEALKDSHERIRLVIDLDANALTGRAEYLKAIGEWGPHLYLIIKGDTQTESGGKLLSLLKKDRIPYIRVKNLRKLSNPDQSVLPVLADFDHKDAASASGIFFIGMEGTAADPRIRLYGELLRLSLGLLAAEKLKSVKELNSPSAQAELLKSLRFAGPGLDQAAAGVMQWSDKGANIVLSALQAYLRESFQAKQALESAA